MFKKALVIATSLLLLLSCDNKSKNNIENMEINNNIYLLVGTYTSDESKGIHIYRMDTISGEASFVSEAEVSNPSYFTISADERFVYTISENDAENSMITAFRLDKEKGKLEKINSRKSGSGPCFVTIDSSGKYIVTADYGGGSISIFKTDRDGGIDGEAEILYFEGSSVDPKRQTKSYLHNVKFSPDEYYLFANDLGADEIYRFDVDKAKGATLLKQTDPKSFKVKEGSGPRHTVFHPSGKFAYLITEISGEVVAFNYNAKDGLFDEIQTVKVDSLNAQGSGDIQITPNGDFLYASNRLQGDGLAILSINKETGMLTRVGYQPTGIHPRNFVILPNGKFLLVANRDSNSVQVFSIDQKTGLLTDMKKDIKLSKPVCLKFASVN